MPLLKLETNVTVAGKQQAELLTTLSKIVTKVLGKPEQYVLVTHQTSAMLMSGQPGHAALVDLRSIGGLTGEVNQTLADQICRALQQSLGIAPERIYLNFTNVPAGDWGWNGDTFG